jgi:hypothetical protein
MEVLMQHRLCHRIAFRVLFGLCVSGALTAATGSSARAQRMPDMATLDRGDGISRIGLDFGAAFVDDSASNADAVMRFDLFGQLVTHRGAGIYASLPFARSVTDGDDETATGNFDVGGLYVIESPTLSLVFRAGVALPTADEDLGGFTTNFLASWTRLTDIAQAIPNMTYLRLGFSPLFHANRLFLRADIGADFGIDEGDEATGLEPNTLVHINFGGGIDFGSVALMAEVVNLATTEDFDEVDSADEDFIHTFAATARFMGRSVQPYLTFGTPIDNFGRDEIDFFLGAGLQVRL